MFVCDCNYNHETIIYNMPTDGIYHKRIELSSTLTASGGTTHVILELNFHTSATY